MIELLSCIFVFLIMAMEAAGLFLEFRSYNLYKGYFDERKRWYQSRRGNTKRESTDSELKKKSAEIVTFSSREVLTGEQAAPSAETTSAIPATTSTFEKTTKVK